MPKFEFSEEPPNMRFGFHHAIGIMTTPNEKGEVWRKMYCD